MPKYGGKQNFKFLSIPEVGESNEHRERERDYNGQYIYIYA